MKYILDNSAFGAPSPRRVQTNPGHRDPSAVAPNYYDSPDWWQLRAAIMKALQDFPEARDSVSAPFVSFTLSRSPMPPLLSQEQLFPEELNSKGN
jgi:hypothetical protein